MKPGEANDISHVVNERLHFLATGERRNPKGEVNPDVSIRKNILIIEDDPELRLLLKMVLQDEYHVTEAGDGEKAIGLLRNLNPDLIVCDVMMPNMNGLEVCNRLKNTSTTCHIPFILLSGRYTPDQQMEGYEVGADAYIAKPFHAGHLRIRIRKMLEQAEKSHQYFENKRSGLSFSDTDLLKADKDFVDQLVTMVEGKLDDTDLHAEQMEKFLCLSKMQLYRKVKTLTGMTPGEFIKYVRISHAAHLLTTTRLTVSEIFYRTGFNNQSYFFREFRKRYLAAPKEYRASQSLFV